VVWVTDDVPPHELVREGHLDRGVRRAIALGMAPVDAVRAATLAPARRLRRHDLGLVAPGRKADLLVLGDLTTFRVQVTIAGGRIVARDGKMLESIPPPCPPPLEALHSIHLSQPTATDFEIQAPGPCTARVLTHRGRAAELRQVPVLGGTVEWQSDPELALATVWHRHGKNANRGAVLVAGSGLREGALATTYAHDAHNLVVLGRSASDMASAAGVLVACGGGYIAVRGGQVLALAELPVAGILATSPVSQLAASFERFIAAARSLGVAQDPIGLLSSLPLPVVPSYRPTDMGLADVNRQTLVPSFEFAAWI